VVDSAQQQLTATKRPTMLSLFWVVGQICRSSNRPHNSLPRKKAKASYYKLKAQVFLKQLPYILQQHIFTMSSTLFMMLIATASMASARVLQQADPQAPFDLSAGLVGSGQERPVAQSNGSEESGNGTIIAVVVVMLLMLCCCGLCCIGGACWYMRKKNKDEKEQVQVTASMGVPYGGPMGKPRPYSDNQSRDTASINSFD
jgi:hypothetical protein